MTPGLFLALAILFEAAATISLRATDGFTRLLPSVGVVVGYSLAFLCLAHSLKAIPVGIAYATWAGAGTVCVAAAAWYVYEEAPSAMAIIGMALIVAGVALVNTHARVH